jgi:hypothetical protein
VHFWQDAFFNLLALCDCQALSDSSTFWQIQHLKLSQMNTCTDPAPAPSLATRVLSPTFGWLAGAISLMVDAAGATRRALKRDRRAI